MTLDMLLLVATIAVAVAAVFVSMAQAVLERRVSARRRAEPGPRELDARRLARAVPAPTRADVPPPTRVEVPRPAPFEAAAPIPVMAPSFPATSTPTPVAPPEFVAASAAVVPEPTERTSTRRSATVAAASVAAVTASAPAPSRKEKSIEPDAAVDPELAYRIGVPGVKRPSRPAVLVVASGEAPATLPSTVATETWPEVPHRRRRAAFRVAAVATALASVLTVLVVLPDLTQQGGVLGETGRPEVSNNAGIVGPGTPTPTLPAATVEPTPSPTPQAMPTPAPTAAPTPSPPPSPSPTPTPAPTAATTPIPAA